MSSNQEFDVIIKTAYSPAELHHISNLVRELEGGMSQEDIERIQSYYGAIPPPYDQESDEWDFPDPPEWGFSK